MSRTEVVNQQPLQLVIFFLLISVTQTTVSYANQTFSTFKSFSYNCNRTNLIQFQDLVAHEKAISVTFEQCIESCLSIQEELFIKANRLEKLLLNFTQGPPDICSAYHFGLSNKTFLGLASLQELYMEGFEKMEKIDSEAFRPLRNLRILSLVGFGSERLPDSELSNAMTALSGTPLQHVEFNGIFTIYSKTKTLNIEQLFRIQNVSIRSVAFDNNVVQLITGRVSKALPDLQIASFSVQFRYASPMPFIADAIISVKYLEELHIYTYPPEEPSNIEYTKFDLRNLDRDITVKLFKELDLSCHWNHRAPLSPYLKVLRMNGLRFLDNRTEGTKLCFQKDNVLEQLDMSGSPLPKRFPLITGLDKLTTLHARQTGIQSISPDQLRFSPALRILDVGANDLHNFFSGTNFSLGDGQNLEIVNLTQCNLHDIPKQLQTTEPKPIQSIDLSQNHLKGADVSLDNFRNLTLLNISGNDIETLSNSSMAQLRKATERNENFVVDLSNNPLSCLCNSTTFVEWMQQLDHPHLHGYTGYLCLHPNGSQVPVSAVSISDITRECKVLQLIAPNATCPCDPSTLTNLSRIPAALLDYRCRNKNGKLVPLSSLDVNDTLKQCSETVFTSPAFLVPVIVGAALIIVTAAVIVAVYRARKQKQIPYAVLGCFDRNCIIRSLMVLIYGTRETTKEFPYEAFVCYHDDDRDRIHEAILSRLTNQEGIVTPEDFALATWSLEETERCIKQSRWIVFLMSKSFVNDNWCKDVVVRSIQRQHAVIPVVLETLELQGDHVISSLLQTNCPLNWSEDNQNEILGILQKKLTSTHKI